MTCLKQIAALFFFFSTLTAVRPVYSQQHSNPATVHLVFTSDPHYGLFKPVFRGRTQVSAHQVNTFMISRINTLPGRILPDDQGVQANRKIGSINYLIQGGDISNRMENQVQSATRSWAEFSTDYFGQLKFRGNDGQPAKLLLLPGNHDISNAIGYPKALHPATDPAVMVQLYNRMMKPAVPRNNQTYDYRKDKINYAVDVAGIQLFFINLWPDSAARSWMEAQLSKISPFTPVIIFTHDQPEADDRHFSNPVPPHRISKKKKFENLLEEQYKESVRASGHHSTDKEQRGWTAFLQKHPNIKAYFHGNSNWNEYYKYHGPDKTVKLPVFRVDSPMKGKYSAKDETLLSFQLISIDTGKQKLTVRECFYNQNPSDPEQAVRFGSSATVSLKVK